MDTHIVMVKSIEGNWRITDYAEKSIADKLVKSNKTEYLDMSICLPIEAANPAVLYESKFDIYVTDANGISRKSRMIPHELGKFKNWLSVWEISNMAYPMIQMCYFVDYKTKLAMACDIADIDYRYFFNKDTNEKDIIEYIKKQEIHLTRIACGE